MIWLSWSITNTALFGLAGLKWIRQYLELVPTKVRCQHIGVECKAVPDCSYINPSIIQQIEYRRHVY